MRILAHTISDIFIALYLLLMVVMLCTLGCAVWLTTKISSKFPLPPETFEEAARRMAGTNDPVKVELMMKAMR